MASISYVVSKLSAAGLTVDVDGDFILCEGPNLNFERSHDGVQGVANWLKETLEDYAAACEEGLAEYDLYQEDEADEPWELSPEYQAAELPQEETVYNFVEWILKALGRNAQPAADPPAREFAPSPPEKGHRLDQLALAQELNMGPKDLWQAAQNDGQDRGGVPNPAGYIRDMKLGAPAVTVLVVGQRFMAPEGWKIREHRPSGKEIYYASILQDHKAKNQARGAEFALVRL